MLRVGKAVAQRTPGRQAGTATGRSGVASADPWQNLGNPDLADTVRRIATLCGWAQARTGPGQTLAVTSAFEREGKSALARALAVSTARDYAADVLLIECDLLNPSLSADFGVEAEPGLTEILATGADLHRGLHATAMPNLWLLPAGGPHDSPSRLLRSTAMTALLDAVRDRFAFTIVELPAVLKSSDASVLARLTDGAVLVVRSGATDQAAVQQAVELLSGSTLHGVVLNRQRSAMPRIVRRAIESVRTRR